MNRLIVLLFFYTSCVYDKVVKIGTVKNNSKYDIVVIYTEDAITNKQLFYGTKNYVHHKTSKEIFNRKILLDSLQVSFWVFNADTVFNLIGSNIVDGIVERSFIKQYKFNTDSLKKINGLINITFSE